jgi:hypothetical protein
MATTSRQHPIPTFWFGARKKIMTERQGIEEIMASLVIWP